MHRQGFFLEDFPKIIKLIKKFNLVPEGLYTHLGAAKDRLYPSVSLRQIEIFKKSDELFKKAGLKNYLRHVCASAGTLLYPEAHFDMVRIGIGLYGSALTWKSLIGEIKNVPAGSFVGYDLTEKTLKPSRLAVIPIGYWHGFDRGLSSMGEVLVKGKRCKIIGRVSMDMIIADVSGIKNAKPGNEVVIIGKSGKESINAEDVAQKIGTINYEVITRINPLIKRIYI